MAGYNYHAGMSNNAVEAYSRGCKPLSQITLDDLREEGIEITKAFATWLAKNDHWPKSEWHHSGGTWYNKVDFYAPCELAELINEGDLDLAALEIEYKESKKAATKEAGRRVKGQFAVFSGSRNHRRLSGYEEFLGVKINNWIHLDAGGKKRADGNYITWKFIDE